MAKKKNLSIEQRASVVTLDKENYSGRAIAKKLKVSNCAVQEILKKVKETGSVKDKEKSGRPRSTTPRQDRLLKHLSLNNRRATSRVLKRDFSDATGASVSCRTVRRRLQKSGLRGCVAAKKPLRTDTHKRKRLNWCLERKNWTEEQWGKVLFSDESTFELIPSRRVWVRRRTGERYNQDCINPTVKYGGGKIQVWGCMSAKGVGTLKVVNGRLDAKAYVRLICHDLKNDGIKLCGNDFIFQQDGAPCHTAKSTKAWFERKNINLSTWPAQSPDLNPIEQLWEEMKKRLEHNPCKNLEELKESIFRCWENLESDVTKNLVCSMPRRCSAVIAARGGHTKY